MWSSSGRVRALWKGLCPFHGEKTPSFNVHEPRQFFHCFGCGEKGDVITFLEKIEQRPFMDVLRDLAGIAGVELEERPLSPAERKAPASKPSQSATGCSARWSWRPPSSRSSTRRRQATPPEPTSRGAASAPRCARASAIGYAPGRWDALSSYLADKQYPPRLVMEQLGLVGVNDRGRYDFFRDRVMLPVPRLRQKRVIGFGGRLLDPEAKDRKYVNSSDSPLYHKKEQLYGLHAALDAIRRGGQVVVVEGNFDVLALHEAGIEEALAPMGTALTTEQLKVLSALSKKIILVFDDDKAGKKAGVKALPELAGLSNTNVFTGVRIARVGDGFDPDDFVRSKGADKFRELIAAARPFLDHLIDEAAKDPTIQGRMEAVKEVAQVLVKLSDPTARELYAQHASGVLGLTAQQVRRALQEAAADVARPARAPEPASAPVAPPTATAPTAGAVKLPREELEVLAVLARNPELFRLPEAARAGDLLLHPVIRQLHRAAIEQTRETGALDVPSGLHAAAPPERAAVSAGMMDDDLSGVADPAGRLRKLTVRLELSRVEAEIDMIGRLQRDAQGRGDTAAARALMARGLELRQTKERLQTELQRP